MFRSLLPAAILLALAALPSAAQAPSAPNVIGQGCTTAFFIDQGCKGVGVGVKASGVYPVDLYASEVLGQAGPYTMGDRPDPDPTDPTLKTTADWQAKWGMDNAGMVAFLQKQKSFTNTARVFYISQSGSDATGVVNDPTHPYRTAAPIMTKLMDLQGGAIIVRGGTWVDLDFDACSYNHGNPCFNLSGSQGHAVYVLAYPGEVVQTDIPLTADLVYKPKPNVCCVTVDGFEFRDDKYGLGDGLSLTNTADFTFINDEFAGWHQDFFGDHTVNGTVKNSVFHDMMYHAVYWGDSVAIGGPGDFDFVANAKNCINGGATLTTMCASSNAVVTGNVMYANGAGGYEPIHLNTYLNGATVANNIVSYSGGTAIALETGIYHADIKSNLFFDNGRDCITLYLYDSGVAAQASTLRWNTIENNVCYVGKQTDAIRGTTPTGGIVQFDNTQTPGHYIKDTTIKNNIIVTYNQPKYWYGVTLAFQRNSHPETDIIQNNDIWSSAAGASSADRVMSVSNDASAVPAAGSAVTVANYTFDQLAAFSPNFTGNTYADPKFKSASPDLTLTPGAFDFATASVAPPPPDYKSLYEQLRAALTALLAAHP